MADQEDIIEETPEEHWDQAEDGFIKGIYLIDPTLARGADLWGKLDEVIRDYAKVHPEEMRVHLLETAARRLDIKNELGTSKTQLRWGCSVPPGLMFQVQKLEPGIFTDKDLFHQFMKKYPGFRICSKV